VRNNISINQFPPSALTTSTICIPIIKSIKLPNEDHNKPKSRFYHQILILQKKAASKERLKSPTDIMIFNTKLKEKIKTISQNH